MQQALFRSGESGAAVALDLWWLRQSYEGARSNRNPVMRREEEFKVETQAKALAILGAEGLANYMADQDGRPRCASTGRRRQAALAQRLA